MNSGLISTRSNEKISNQEGGDLSVSLITLGLPLGLSLLATSQKPEVNKDQTGGSVLSPNFLSHVGLSITPLALISLLHTTKEDMSEDKQENTSEDKPENKQEEQKDTYSYFSNYNMPTSSI